ncbi:MAG TPA: butyrate kinase [candidate division Zixibacteria bacterium]|nr:butyrate kinase [candidate division Zixibacteria bacterium]
MVKILAINPGATSTKVAVYEDEKPLFEEVIRHTAEELGQFERTNDQHTFRSDTIRECLKKHNFDIAALDAVVGRGGPFKPLVSGTYKVNEAMKSDVENGNVQADHISNIGCLLADEIAQPLGIPAFIVDPVSVDEFDDVAYVSGIEELPRVSLSHALNIKMIAKRYARETGKKYDESNLVIVHLGGGISVTAHRAGQMIDVSNANDGGPFSPQRCGQLPVTGLVKLCYSGKYAEKELMGKLLKRGGFSDLVGSDNVVEISSRRKTDAKCDLAVRAFVYQVAKEIGAYASALKGEVDAILITGGIAFNDDIMREIGDYVEWIAPVRIYPGEDELEGLVMGALRVLNGEEAPKDYA